MTIADASYWMGFTRDLFAVLAILVGALLALTLYGKLRPMFSLRVLPRWVDQRRLILRFEIENTSRVLALVTEALVGVQEVASHR